MEIVNNIFEKEGENVFNTPLEIGLRTLFILDAMSPKDYDLNSLVIFDYFLLNSGDFPNGPKSIHPGTPHRGAQLIIKPLVMQHGLNLMTSKELININFGINGITYSSNALTNKFLEFIDSEYSKSLKLICNWMKEEFGNYDMTKLQIFVKNNIPDWGSEFIYESLIRENV